MRANRGQAPICSLYASSRHETRLSFVWNGALPEPLRYACVV